MPAAPKRLVRARAIAHPNFKNFTPEQVTEYLKDKEPLDAIIRPSTTDSQHLSVTWKLFNDLELTIPVEERDKPNDWYLPSRLLYLLIVRAIGKQLVVHPGTPNELVFEDLDELVMAFVDPISRNMHAVVEHPYTLCSE